MVLCARSEYGMYKWRRVGVCVSARAYNAQLVECGMLFSEHNVENRRKRLRRRGGGLGEEPELVKGKK